MKSLLVAGSLLLVGFLVFSCSKKSMDRKQPYGNYALIDTGVSGLWTIVYDSNYVGAGLGNHLVVYKGQSGDFFNFQGNDTLVIKENGQYDTSGYHLYSSSSIAIDVFPSTCAIDGYNTTSMTLTSFFSYTPGGTFGRKVILSR